FLEQQPLRPTAGSCPLPPSLPQQQPRMRTVLGQRFPQRPLAIACLVAGATQLVGAAGASAQGAAAHPATARAAPVALAAAPQGAPPRPHQAAPPDQQLGTIVGRVLDARSREGVAGATVVVEGTRLGAIASADGRYRITGVTPGAHTLTARRIGYVPARLTVTVVADQEVTADFTLESAAMSLEQVVVTGTPGGEQRRSIGNAVSTVSAPDVLAKSAAPDLGSLLNARAAGVVVVPGTGRLGAGPTIQIRGRSSLSLEN